VFNSRKLIHWSVRWSLVLLGIAAAWLIPFGEADVARAIISLIILGIGAFKQYKDAKHSKRVDARMDAVENTTNTISSVAQTASRTAEAAQRGRHLSPDQMAAIAARLSRDRLSGIGATVAYDPDATEARDFGQSIADFLTNVGVHCNGPHAISPTGYPQPRQPIQGTLFIVKSSPPDAVEKLAEAFASTVTEIRRSGEGSHGHVNINDQIKIIVGHKP
jgi:hypothetical protein